MLEVKAPLYLEGQGEALRKRNRPPLSNFIRIILSPTLCLSVKFPCFLNSLETGEIGVIEGK